MNANDKILKQLALLKKEARSQYLAKKTIDAYLIWNKQYMQWLLRTHHAGTSAEKIEAFLSYLANERNVAQSTQSVAKNAIVYFYRNVRHEEPGDFSRYNKSTKEKRLPTVFSRQEVLALFDNMHGVHLLMAQLLYGSGLRLNEACALRVKDLDLDQREVFVRAGKGKKDRVTILADDLVEPLREHIAKVRMQHDRDLAAGFGSVDMPNALARKYPSAAKSFGWQYVFPSSRLIVEEATGQTIRWHIHDTGVQKAIKQGIRAAGIHKQAGPHTLRHSFATHMMEDGYPMEKIRDLLGHTSIKTTAIYTHVMNKGAQGVVSPMQRLRMPAPMGQVISMVAAQ